MKNKDLIEQNINLKRYLRRLNSKKKQKLKRKSEQGLDKEKRHKNYLYNYKYKNYAKIKAPSHLSMIDDPERTLHFINKLRDKFYLEKSVFVILESVEFIDYDAIVVLLSIMIRFKSKNIQFNGDYPKNREAQAILIESGFFEYLYYKVSEKDRYDMKSMSTISTHAWKKVDSELTSRIISNATKTIWEDEKRCTGVQKCFIELMHNTNNHADTEVKGTKHWFLSVQHKKKEKIVKFSFVDFGVGIFESLNSKKDDSKWYDWKSKLTKFFTFDNNSELLKLILEGKLHQTVTGDYFRGKGLPGMYESLSRNQINNLHIISNDVYSDIENNKYLALKNRFNGTFVYWELNENNVFLEV